MPELCLKPGGNSNNNTVRTILARAVGLSVWVWET